MKETVVFSTVIGNLRLEMTGEKVTGLLFTNEPVQGEENAVTKEIREYLAGEREAFSAVIEPEGTPFQKKVWVSLMNIPYGETRSYGEIAAMVGNPKAGRAVGMACNRNPIAIIVPCHRVVGSGGSLTGYAGGLTRKEFLLALEQKKG